MIRPLERFIWFIPFTSLKNLTSQGVPLGKQTARMPETERFTSHTNVLRFMQLTTSKTTTSYEPTADIRSNTCPHIHHQHSHKTEPGQVKTAASTKTEADTDKQRTTNVFHPVIGAPRVRGAGPGGVFRAGYCRQLAVTQSL